ncbi:MAG: caspase family protein [Elusimicrobia bacterium]|nr:caspase family protein [Elusimicrobiota bacterium]
MVYPRVLVAVAAALCCLSSGAQAASQAWGAYLAGDHEKALALARAEAKADNLEAFGLLGLIYWQGDQVPKDPAQAQGWFKKYVDGCQELAKRGDAYGHHGLGWMYQNGWGGLPRDVAQAVRQYKKAADFQWSQYDLGRLYYDGTGIKQDYAEAAKWWRKAADQGNAPAQGLLSWLYYNGWGVKKDIAEAVELGRRSADAGDVFGRHWMGCIRYFGIGVPQDYAEAGRLWELAAAHGSPHAPWGLGLLYRGGLGGYAKNHGEAVKWFRTGVERGELGYAAAELGAAYEAGEGVVQDFVEAYKWYLLAALRENPAAREGMKRLSQAMTKEQVAEAQKLANAYQAVLAGQPAPALRLLVSDVDAPALRLVEKPAGFALVVGVENYKDLPSAQFAERDADSMRKTLLALGYPERNVVTLKGSEATIAGLRKYLEEWLPRNVGENSSVFFYFSGHGAPDPGDGTSYLVPWDGDPSYLKSTAYPLEKVLALLSGLKAKRVVAVTDACFSGAGGRSVLAKGARPLVTKVGAAAVPGNLTVFAAASGDQITSTLDDQGHGTFTYYFLKGLSGAAKDGSGAVTAKGLYDYLKPKVQDAARRQNRDQEPVLHGSGDKELVRF